MVISPSLLLVGFWNSELKKLSLIYFQVKVQSRRVTTAQCRKTCKRRKAWEFLHVTTQRRLRPLELARGDRDGNGKSRSAGDAAVRGRGKRGPGHSRALAYMQCDDTPRRERCTLQVHSCTLRTLRLTPIFLVACIGSSLYKKLS